MFELFNHYLQETIALIIRNVEEKIHRCDTPHPLLQIPDTLSYRELFTIITDKVRHVLGAE